MSITLQYRQYWHKCIRVMAWVLVPVMIGLTSCVHGLEVSSTPTSLTTPATILQTKSPLPEDWETRWLKGIPCHPPCWEGITPGHTTAAEAIEILKSSPWITTTKELIPDDEYRTIVWKWVGKQEGGLISFWRQLPQVVNSIRPDFPRYFRLGKVIEAYGEPSHVMAWAYYGPDSGDGVFYELEIVYQPQGFILRASYSGKPDLNTDTLVSVTFFAPNDKRYLTAFSDPGMAVPWQGFKGFDFYCRDSGKGACRGDRRD